MLIEMLTQSTAPRRPMADKRLTGRAVLAMMIAFFIVVASVNAVMMSMAIRTMPGLDARNGYEVSQRYNGEIARMASQSTRGWAADATVARVGGAAQVNLVLTDRDGRSLDGLAVTARLLHPASRQLDHSVVLAAAGDGRYAASIPGITRGQWTLTIDAERDGQRLFTSQNRVFLKD